MPEFFDVTVVSGAKVTFDERFFTEQLRADFRRYYFRDVETLEEHAHHIAQLAVRQVPGVHVFTAEDGSTHRFYRYEGYGWVVIDDEDPAVLGSEWSGVRVASVGKIYDVETQERKTL